MARLKRATATSAGGIVIRSIDGIPHLVAGRRRRQRDGVTWTLPKGTPNPNETLEETALREVAEETGLQVRLLAPLDAIEYWFVQGGTRIHKTVHYWLMEPVGGDLDGHDHEFDEVRWVPLREAPALLTFETERALVERGRRRRGGRAHAGGTPEQGGPSMTDEPRATPLVERHEALGRPDGRLRRLADADPVRRASSRSTAPSASGPASSTCATWASCSSTGPDAGDALAARRDDRPPDARDRAGPTTR